MHYRFIQELLQAMEILPSCFIQSSNYENNFVNTSNDIQTNFKQLLCYCKHRTIILQDSRVQREGVNVLFRTISMWRAIQVRHLQVSIQK